MRGAVTADGAAAPRCAAGARDDDAQRAELGGRIDRGLVVGLGSRVAGDEVRARPELLHDRGRALGIAVEDQHRRALRVEVTSRRLTEARGTSGDQRDVSLDLHCDLPFGWRDVCPGPARLLSGRYGRVNDDSNRSHTLTARRGTIGRAPVTGEA